jgi:hypothetical protein
VGPDAASPGGRQIQQLHAAAASLDYHHVLTRLPPPIAYIFKANTETGCRSRRLLVGRTTTTCTWAVLRVIPSGYNKGATIVCYLTEHMLVNRAARNGSGLHQMPVDVAGQPLVLRAANLPPFGVFAGYGDPYHQGQAFRLLSIFVQYVFLATGERGKVVADEAVSGCVEASVMEYWIDGLKALDQGCEWFTRGAICGC